MPNAQEATMSDQITVGDIKDTTATAIGDDATATVTNIIHQAPKVPITFPHYYIAIEKNPHFTGRTAELESIHTAVQNGGVGVITQAIAGLGGVGKTQLAAHYAHLHLTGYDLIYWLPAESELTLMEAMATLAYRLQVAELEAAQPQAAARAAITWLENSRQRWLLIVDNADLPQMTPAIVRRYLPKTGNGAVLLSSRNSDWGRWKPLQLNDFSDDEAVDFMASRLGAAAVADRDSAVALAQALGGLALALEHAVAYVQQHTKTIADYLRLFRQRREALWAKATPPADYREKTITTTWTLSFEALAVDAPDAAALLNLCAFFAPDGIPTALLTAHADRLPPPLDACAADELRLDQAIAAAKGHSLLAVVDGGLNMHRLVQFMARERLGTAAADVAAAALDLFYEAYNFDIYDMDTWAVSGELMPHLTAAVQAAAAAGVESDLAGYLNTHVGFYLHHCGEYVAAKPYYKRALALGENVLSTDHFKVATALNNLAGLLQAMGEYGEARPFYERALAIYENKLGPDHPDIAISLNNLAGLLQSMEKYGEARLLYERALAIKEAQPDSNYPSIAISLNNLALLLQSMGEYGEARPFYERALAIREKALVSDHPDIAQSLNNLAWLAYKEGDKQEAARLMRQALTIWEKTLGDAHPNTKASRQSLATFEAAL